MIGKDHTSVKTDQQDSHQEAHQSWHIIGAGAIGCLWAYALKEAGLRVTLIIREHASIKEQTMPNTTNATYTTTTTTTTTTATTTSYTHTSKSTPTTRSTSTT
ncbi:MAG: 2-dehydropantoate 2-reductase N-terminal domain-containing protein [Pseudomonadales bacterium]